MKLTRASIPALLLLCLLLSGCGISNSAPSRNSSFAFLQFDGSAPAIRHGLTRASFVTTSREAADIQPGGINAYRMDAVTAKPVALSTKGGWYTGIQLSADGKRVVFSAVDGAGFQQIFVANADDFGNPTQLTTSAEQHAFASFSPDGGRVVMSVLRQQSNGLWCWSLVLISADGGGETALPYVGSSAVFTPDGKQIIFSGASSLQRSALFIMNSDGSGVTQLTNPGNAAGLLDAFPSVSPDGSTILFTRGTYKPGDHYAAYDLYQVGFAGESASSPAKRLTTGGATAAGQYAGDGIVYLNSVAVPTLGTGNIFAARTDASAATRLSQTETACFLHCGPAFFSAK